MKDDFYILRLVTGGYSYSEIATMTSMRRETIAARVARMRLAGMLDPYDRPVVPRSEPVGSIEQAMKELPFEVKVKSRKVRPPAGVKGVHILDLAPNDCRYPVAHADAHFFCGEPRRDAKTSYCAAHHTKVWVNARSAYRGENRKRESQKDEERGSRVQLDCPAHG